MGATLANGGVNPVTGEQAIDTRYCKRVLAVLATAGLYEQSGQWLYDVGLPGKSGVAGGIVTVSPGKGGLGTFSPPLDGAGNSVRGQRITRYLSEALGLNLFASAPAGLHHRRQSRGLPLPHPAIAKAGDTRPAAHDNGKPYRGGRNLRS
jgi:glutaminase